MTDAYKSTEQTIKMRHRFAVEKGQELQENVRKLTKGSYAQMCRDMQWRFNEMMNTNSLILLWEEAKDIITDYSHSEDENIAELTNLMRITDNKLRACSLSNMRVDGHGIEELESHKALAEFAKDLSSVLLGYVGKKEFTD